MVSGLPADSGTASLAPNLRHLQKFKNLYRQMECNWYTFASVHGSCIGMNRWCRNFMGTRPALLVLRDSQRSRLFEAFQTHSPFNIIISLNSVNSGKSKSSQRVNWKQNSEKGSPRRLFNMLVWSREKLELT